jgi:5-(aminomethyl)-3-furanmethanol phosphate kinase
MPDQVDALVEAVVKVGGSLAESDALRSLCHQISELAREHRLLVVPGGGPFADNVRRYYDYWQLSETAAHKMAILAMDQYGYLLCDLIADSVPVTSFAEVEALYRDGKVPVLIPSSLLFHLDPLPHSWTVTSDSIAAWGAVQLRARLLVLLKAVDGVRGTADQEQWLTEATLDQLEGSKVVDEYLPVILSEADVNTWIVNGRYPERLAELITRGETRGTHLRRA